MSPLDIVGLLWRHVVAVTVIFVLTSGFAYHFEHADPGYTDTATIAFTAPSTQGFFTHGNSLLVIDELTANTVMSAAGQSQVTKAGGTANYNVALVNLNDEDYPNYSEPYVTVTTTSPDPGAAGETMSAVMTVLAQDLSGLQTQQGAKAGALIELREIATTGPVAQTGSRKRVLAGLAILSLIAAYITARLLDRRPVRLREVLQKAARKDVHSQNSRASSARFLDRWPHFPLRSSLWWR